MSNLHAKGLEAAAQIAEAFADSEELEAIAGMAASTGVHSEGWLKDALHSHGQEVARRIAEAIRAALSNAEPAGADLRAEVRAEAAERQLADMQARAERAEEAFEICHEKLRAAEARPQPAADVVEALRALTSAVANMRVPQNVADAALQVQVTIGPAFENAQRTLAALEAKGAGAESLDAKAERLISELNARGVKTLGDLAPAPQVTEQAVRAAGDVLLGRVNAPEMSDPQDIAQTVLAKRRRDEAEIARLRSELAACREALERLAVEFEKEQGYDDDLRRSVGMETVGQHTAKRIRAALSPSIQEAGE